MRQKALGIMMVVVLLTTVCLAACGGDNGGNGDTTTTTTTTAATTAVQTTESTTAQPSNGGGDGFTWNDMPIYPGADQVQEFSISIPPEDEDYTDVEWRYYECGASVEDVVDFYKDKMPDNGWEDQIWRGEDQPGDAWDPTPPDSDKREVGGVPDFPPPPARWGKK